MKFAAALAIPAILANAASIGLQQQNANVSKCVYAVVVFRN
jgi:hypothetical protein